MHRLFLAGLLCATACRTPDLGPPPPAAAPAAGRPGAVQAALIPPQPKLRLPRNFLPTSHDARLVIDPAQPTFQGELAIEGQVSVRSSGFWLHARRLTISRAEAIRGERRVPMTATSTGAELLALRSAEPLEPGPWTFHFEYTGELDPLNTAGAFKQTVGGATYVYSQLEATYARRVFPCLDEPDVKVPWSLTLDVPDTLVAVSNTPEQSTAPLGPGKKRVSFGRTKPLPSYLVAFGVGPFEIIDSGKTKGGTPVRIVTLAGRAADASYAAETVVKIVELTEDWFGIPYPYEKLDMLTIPLTVGFGAMENAGLITYTETLMLHPPHARSRLAETTWVVVAAHEIAHQWFGDLVTAAFWDDIWLNEAFATWMQLKIAERFDPANLIEEDRLDPRHNALEEDALPSARRIRQAIETPDDINNVFDSITYQKGAAVLGMFEHHVGPQVFQRGVQDYLRARAFGNATAQDFVAAVSQASGRPLDAAFSTFLDRPGAPELRARLDCSRADAPALVLSQARYAAPGMPAFPAVAPWKLPVCVAYDAAGKRKEACTLLETSTSTLTLEAGPCPRWVMPNVRARGYFRTVYREADVVALRDLGWSQLVPSERRTIFFDLTEASRGGRLPLALALSLIPPLLAEPAPAAAVDAITFVETLEPFVPDADRASFERWIGARFGERARQAGFAPRPDDTIQRELLRRSLVGAVGRLGRDKVLVAEAVRLTEKWDQLPRPLRGVIFALAANADRGRFETLRTAVFTETDRARRSELIGALGGVDDPALHARALELALDPKLDPRETVKVLFSAVTRPGEARARRFVEAHLDEILARLPNTEVTQPIARLAELFTGACEAASRDGVAAYVRKHFAPLAGGARLVEQNIEAMDQCIAKRQALEPQLSRWLRRKAR